MAFTALTPTEVSANKPISTTLMDKVRTNFDDHEARLLASGGSGSIGEVLNGSFETAQGGNPNWPDKWAIAQYSGGQVILDGTYTSHGKKSLKMLHTVSGGGGGYAESDYIGVSSLYMPPLNFSYLCSVASMSIEVWVRYYAADGSGNPSTYLGERRVYNMTSGNPLTWSAAQIYNVPLQYTSTRYVKYRFIGGVNGTTQTGNVWFDAVGVPIRRVIYPFDNPNPINQGNIAIGYNQGWANAGTVWSIPIPNGFRWLIIRGACFNATSWDDNAGAWTYNDPLFRFTLAGTGRYSTVITDNGRHDYQAYNTPPPSNHAGWVWNDMVFDLGGLAGGTYSLQFQTASSPGNYGINAHAQCPTVANVSNHYATSGFINADGTRLTVTDVYNSVPLW